MAPKSNRLAIFGLKTLDIFLLCAYYFLFAFFMASLIDWFIGRFDTKDEDKKPTWQLLLESIVYTFVLVFSFYIARNVVELIPFPFEGAFGFQHERVKERSGDVVFIFVLFFYQNYYTDKLNFLQKRLQEWIKQTFGKSPNLSGSKA
jgi:hypothetical protein